MTSIDGLKPLGEFAISQRIKPKDWIIMTSKPDHPKSLGEDDIKVSRMTNRRRAMGLVAAGSAVLGVAAPAVAQASDGDTGAWDDSPGCGRGPGGSRTGMTDADNGAISDAAGRGRGAPRC